MVTPVFFQTPVKVGFFSAVMMCDGRFHCWWESPGVKPRRHVYLSSCSNGLDTVFTINIGTSQLPCKLFLKSFKNDFFFKFDEVKFCKPRPEYSYAGCLILVDTTCSCLLIFRIYTVSSVRPQTSSVVHKQSGLWSNFSSQNCLIWI